MIQSNMQDWTPGGRPGWRWSSAFIVLVWMCALMLFPVIITLLVLGAVNCGECGRRNPATARQSWPGAGRFPVGQKREAASGAFITPGAASSIATAWQRSST